MRYRYPCYNARQNSNMPNDEDTALHESMSYTRGIWKKIYQTQKRKSNRLICKKYTTTNITNNRWKAIWLDIENDRLNTNNLLITTQRLHLFPYVTAVILYTIQCNVLKAKIVYSKILTKSGSKRHYGIAWFALMYRWVLFLRALN